MQIYKHCGCSLLLCYAYQNWEYIVAENCVSNYNILYKNIIAGLSILRHS